jgi:hypothetical protein
MLEAEEDAEEDLYRYRTRSKAAAQAIPKPSSSFESKAKQGPSLKTFAGSATDIQRFDHLVVGGKHNIARYRRAFDL